MSFLKSTRAKVVALLVALLVVPPLILFGYSFGLQYYPTYLYGVYLIKTNSSPVCYNWGMGGHTVDGVRHKQCVCDGKLADMNQPGVMYESGVTYCVGNITGYEYEYGGRDFRDFDAWNKFCENVGRKDGRFTEPCFQALEGTRTAELKLEALNEGSQ